VPTGRVKRLLARVRVEDIGYVLVESFLGDSKSESEVQWYQDSQVINV